MSYGINLSLMASNSEEFVEWSPAKLQDFIEAYQEAKHFQEDDEDRTFFLFDGRQYDFGYAKYLIEFLKAQFQGRSQQ